VKTNKRSDYYFFKQAYGTLSAGMIIGVLILAACFPQQISAQSMSVTTLAGGGASGNTIGSIDGIGSSALFNWPHLISTDAFGAVYVADSLNHLVRVVFPNRTVITLAGGGASGILAGSNDGIGSSALFNLPVGISVDFLGTVYVADFNNNRIRAIYPNRTVVTYAGGGSTGTQSGSIDGMGSNALFMHPFGIASDAPGTLFVADAANSKIRAIFPNRSVVTFAGGGTTGTQSGSNNGIGSNALFHSPVGLSLDAFGTMYVGDRQNNLVRAIFPNRTVITLAGGGATGTQRGSNNGVGSNALFNDPYGVSVDTHGTIYVADFGNNQIRAIFSNRTVVAVAGGGASGNQTGVINGIGYIALFNSPRGVAVDAFGTVYVGDSDNRLIRAIVQTCSPGSYVGTRNSCPSCGAGSFSSTVDAVSCTLCPAGTFSDTGASVCSACVAGLYSAQGATSCDYTCPIGTFSTGISVCAPNSHNPARSVSVRTLAGGGVTGKSVGFSNGIGTNALFNNPHGIFVASDGIVYVADAGNNRVRAILPNRTVISLAAGGGLTSIATGSTNGFGSNALFNFPRSVTVDATGTVFVADSGNHKIRAVSPSGNVVTIAGGGLSGTLAGSVDGTGSNALFNVPYDIALGQNGILFVADSLGHRIRAILPNQTGPYKVLTFSGGNSSSQSGSIDGDDGSALFKNPEGVYIDQLGTGYVADYGNSLIRAIFQNRSTITVAGGGSTRSQIGSNNGVGSNALFSRPQDVAVDAFGTIYVADLNNHKIRAIFPNRTVITLAGGNSSGVSSGSNNGIGTNALFFSPYSITADSSGTVYVADTNNHKIRVISSTCFPGSYVSDNLSCVSCSPGTFSITVDSDSCSPCAAGTFSGEGDQGCSICAAGSFSIAGASSCDYTAASCPAGTYASGAASCDVVSIALSVSDSVTSLAGGNSSGTTEGSIDGIGSNALFNTPFGVSVDSVGKVYVVDTDNHKVRAIFPNRTVITVAGGGASGTLIGSNNGIGTNALFSYPTGVSVDTFGTVYRC
jgi:sugar lactone lactonase YvrE